MTKRTALKRRSDVVWGSLDPERGSEATKDYSSTGEPFSLRTDLTLQGSDQDLVCAPGRIRTSDARFSLGTSPDVCR